MGLSQEDIDRLNDGSAQIQDGIDKIKGGIKDIVNGLTK